MTDIQIYWKALRTYRTTTNSRVRVNAMAALASLAMNGKGRVQELAQAALSDKVRIDHGEPNQQVGA